MLTLIGLFIFAFAELVYDYSAVGEVPEWSIFYFASTYLAATIIAFDLLFRENSKAIRLTAISFGVFFVILMISELTFIGVPFDEYIINVNAGKIKILALGLLSVVLIFISLMAWEKIRTKS